MVSTTILHFFLSTAVHLDSIGVQENDFFSHK